MNLLQKSDEFDAWLTKLKDQVGKAKIVLRLDRATNGNFGDCEPVGEGVYPKSLINLSRAWWI